MSYDVEVRIVFLTKVSLFHNVHCFGELDRIFFFFKCMSQEPHLNSLSDDQFYGTSDFLSVGKYYENRKVATKKRKEKRQ